MSLIDEKKVIILEREFNLFSATTQKKAVDIVDFTKIFLKCFPQKQHEILFFTMAFIDLFKQIAERKGMAVTVSLTDFTEYICEYIVSKDTQTYKDTTTVHMPEQRKFNNNNNEAAAASSIMMNPIRDIDLHPAILYGESEAGIKRLIPSSIVTDSSKHNNSSIISGVYARNLQRLITLDSLAVSLNVYHLNNKLERTLAPFNAKENSSIIVAFAYSDREQRIGLCLKDANLIFIDHFDVKNQKCFKVGAFETDHQTNIWYLDSFRWWVTTNKQNSLIVWDLDNEIPKRTMQFDGTISHVLEITQVHLIAVAVAKKIHAYDVNKESIVFTIDLGNAGVQNMVYSYQLATLISVGYENSISLYRINQHHRDRESTGKLIGHSSLVTALQIIEQTPMLISADDGGNIKVWDIRSLKCLQTFNIGNKAVISSIVSLYEKNAMCFLGTRVNLIDFEDEQMKHTQPHPTTGTTTRDQPYPLKVEYDRNKEELIICTKKDVRVTRMSNGRTQKIFQGLLTSPENEIVSFSSINAYNQFILADSTGKLSLHSSKNAEQLKQLNHHASQITSLKIDFINKLILSSSLDGKIIIQRDQEKGDAEIKRIMGIALKNQHHHSQQQKLQSPLPESPKSNHLVNEDITLMEKSIFHNLIISSNDSNIISFWNFEFGKLICSVYLPRKHTPVAYTFLNPYPLLLISTSAGVIFLLKFQIQDFIMSFTLLGDFPLIAPVPEVPSSPQQGVSIEAEQQLSPKEQQPVASTNQELINLSNRSNSIGLKSPKLLSKTPQHSNSLNSLQRKTVVSFGERQPSIHLKQKNSIQLVSPQHKAEKQPKTLSKYSQKRSLVLDNSNKRNSVDTVVQAEELEQELEDENGSNCATEWCTKLLADVESEQQTGNLTQIKVFAATNKGYIHEFIIGPDVFSRMIVEKETHSNQRQNYNPLRLSVDEQHKERTSRVFNISQLHNWKEGSDYTQLRNFQAHKEQLTSFQFIDVCGLQCMLTSSVDSYVRIWSFNEEKQAHELLGSFNINHPLPVHWQIRIDHHEKVKQRVFYALKVLSVMFEKYIDQHVRDIAEVDRFIVFMLQSAGSVSSKSIVKERHDNKVSEATRKIQVMKDEYTPNDVRFEEIKRLFEKQLRGPSIKQLESKKRLRVQQESSVSTFRLPVFDPNEKKKKMEEQEILSFLGPHWRSRFVHDFNSFEATRSTVILEKKLEAKAKERANMLLLPSITGGDTVTVKTHHSSSAGGNNTTRLTAAVNSVLRLKNVASQLVNLTYRGENKDTTEAKRSRSLKRMGRKNKPEKAKSMDFMRYAQERKYIDEDSSIVSGSTTMLSSPSSGKMILSHRGSIGVLEQIQSQQQQQNTVLEGSIMLSKSPLNTSIVSEGLQSPSTSRSTSTISTHLSQKARMHQVMKNIEEKLKLSRFQPEKAVLQYGSRDRYVNQSGSQSMRFNSVLDEQPIVVAPNRSIVAEALGEDDMKLKEILKEMDLRKQAEQARENNRGMLKNYLDHLRVDMDANRGEFREKPSAMFLKNQARSFPIPRLKPFIMPNKNIYNNN